MSKRTKAVSITAKVRKEVYNRDNGCCVLCGTPRNLQTAHYISRARGGLGIPQNLVMLCCECHFKYDQTTERQTIRRYLYSYLSRYYNMEKTNLIYKGEKK